MGDIRPTNYHLWFGAIWWLAGLMVSACVAHAQTQVSFPLDGWYHPGRFMPVQVQADGPITLHAAGAIATQVGQEGGPVRAVVPWLVIGNPTSANVNDSPLELTLHPLSPQQKLIGYTTTSLDPDLADPSAVAIAIDREQLLSSAPAAWQSLDRLVLDESTLARCTPEQAMGWLANGTELIAHSSAMPWVQQGAMWRVKLNLLGPSTARPSEQVYLPTLGWSPGWPAAMRYSILLAAIIFSGILLLLILLRWRWILWAATGFCLLSWLAIIGWQRITPAIFTADGSIEVEGAVYHQQDHWRWLTAHSDTSARQYFDGLTLPLAYDPHHLDPMNIHLICRADGKPAYYSFALPSNNRVAFLSRQVSLSEVRQGHQVQPMPPDRTSAALVRLPLNRLMQPLYMQQGVRVVDANRPGESMGRIVLSQD